VTLAERAETWIEHYWNAQHLVRTRDWLLELEPEPGEALVLAALTHDMERHFPGGPTFAPGTMAPDEPAYRMEHSERSAGIVGEWLRGQGGDEELVTEVEELILLHETGGSPEADLLQAADSLSFLEVNADLVAAWALDGRCSKERAKEQLTYMLERIRLDRARELANPLYVEGLAVVDAV
jgi:hypothetical protein